MSRYLLDSHTWLWMLEDSPRLGHRTRRLITAADSALLLSVASVWELAIKVRAGKLNFPLETERDFEEQIRLTQVDLFPIEHTHAIAAAALPRHHGDPFDRMLIAQAQSLRIPILTVDAKIAAYEVEVIAD